MKKQISVLLLGYSGKRNFGDDLLLKQAYDFLDAEKIKMTIHTSNCGRGSDYLIEWFPKAQIVKSITITLSIIKHHSHVLYFGGGVFFDYNKLPISKYIKRYLSILKLVILPRLLWKVKFAGIGIGLGPFSSSRAEKLCKVRLEAFDYLNVRDIGSKNKCEEWGLKDVSVSPDLSFGFLKYLSVPEKTFPQPRQKKLLICPREYPHGKNRNKYLASLVDLASVLICQGYDITVFAFQGNHDEKVLECFRDLKIEKAIWNPDTMALIEVFNLFGENDLVISARMHGIFISGMVNTPSIGIGVHPKLAYASKFFENSVTISEASTLEHLKKNFKYIEGLTKSKIKMEDYAKECNDQYKKIIQWLKMDTKNHFKD